MKYAELNKKTLIIANDPDADRLAAAEWLVKGTLDAGGYSHPYVSPKSITHTCHLSRTVYSLHKVLSDQLRTTSFGTQSLRKPQQHH
jgi:hypothetical protein